MRLRTGSSALSTFNPPTGPRALSHPQATQSPYDGLRAQADRERRENHRADPQIQNGTYGFDEQNGRSSQARNGRGNGRFNHRRENGLNRGKSQQEKGLYSDEMMVDAPPSQSARGGRGFR
jgi:hypothetical protein